MKKGISGFVYAKNAIKLDYCLELSARSLLHVVDELILCDSNSTDGTLDLMHSIEGARVINYDVENPVNTPLWCPIWRNFVRKHCTYEMHIALDADEVLSGDRKCHDSIRAANSLQSIRAFNFWRDEKTLLPFGCCEDDYIVKIAPSDKHCQYGDRFPDLPQDDVPKINHEASLFHVGFLRAESALLEKCRIIHTAHVGMLDPRYEQGAREGKRVHEIDWGWTSPLRSYDGDYPDGLLEWIKKRSNVTL